jgi:hypothetical protein
MRPSPTLELAIPMPEGHEVVGSIAISRDGKRISFSTEDDAGDSQLYVRELDSFEFIKVPDSRDASNPAFTPDGRSVLFANREGLLRAPVDGGAAPPLVTGRLAVPVTGRAANLRVALHGFAAYAAIRAALDELAAALGRTAATNAPHLALSFPDDHTIVVESPAGDAVVVASPWPAEVAPRGTRFAPYMDLYPESFHGDGVVVLSAKNRRLAATLLRADGHAQVFVVTPHYLLLWLLYEAHRAEGDAAPERRDTYRAFYLHTLDVLRAAEDIYADTLEATDDPAARAAVMALFAASPFAPTVSTIGDRNLSASYIINIASNAQTLRDTPPAVLGLDADVAGLLTGLPMNYYPAKAKPRPPFAYDANPMFSERAGLRVHGK